MKTIEVQKEILKSKINANFSHYCHGYLYYNVQLISGLYQFPISVVDEGPTINDDDSGLSWYEIETLVLSEDLGTTNFDAIVKGSFLNRWIRLAIENDDFIKIKN